MGRKKANYPLIEGIEIVDVAAEGKSLGRIGDMVVFVPMTVPGDIVDVQIRSKRRRFMEGYVVRYVRRSELRQEPRCSYFGMCGGCKWQHLPYSEQLRIKQSQVYDQLTRIGKITLPRIGAILGSQREFFYRNKLDFTFSDQRWMTSEEIASERNFSGEPALGFHIPGRFDKVLDIGECFLQDDPSNSIREAVRTFCIENEYSFYNVRQHSGLMRSLIIRTASTGEVMVIVVFACEQKERIEALMCHLGERFPQITSLFYVVNSKLNDTIDDQQTHLFRGLGHITEQMEDLRFSIGPKSFYQTNSRQAYELYKVVRDFADLSGGELVYDLYTGTGTIANFLARDCRQVIGVEYIPEAIRDAEANARLNGLPNTRFYAGDMKEVLTEGFIRENGFPDVVILDPPRAGLHPDVVSTLLGTSPRKIVYVSCNPATQARDLALLDERYCVTRVQPVDMFPQTHHVENVVQLMLRDYHPAQSNLLPGNV